MKQYLILEESAMIEPDRAVTLDAIAGEWDDALALAEKHQPCVIAQRSDENCPEMDTFTHFPNLDNTLVYEIGMPDSSNT